MDKTVTSILDSKLYQREYDATGLRLREPLTGKSTLLWHHVRAKDYSHFVSNSQEQLSAVMATKWLATKISAIGATLKDGGLRNVII